MRHFETLVHCISREWVLIELSVKPSKRRMQRHKLDVHNIHLKVDRFKAYS